MKIEFVTASHALWMPATDHVRAVYLTTFGASVTQFAAELAVGLDPAGAIICVAGVRAAPEDFYSQHYLDLPVHQLLGELAQQEVGPADIFEICSMVCQRPVAALTMLDAITAQARIRGKEWAVFTATAPLRAMLRRAGIAMSELGVALPERVAQPSAWGRYYQNEPRVCAVRDHAGERLAFRPRRMPPPPGGAVAEAASA